MLGGGGIRGPLFMSALFRRWRRKNLHDRASRGREDGHGAVQQRPAAPALLFAAFDDARHGEAESRPQIRRSVGRSVNCCKAAECQIEGAQICDAIITSNLSVLRLSLPRCVLSCVFAAADGKLQHCRTCRSQLTLLQADKGVFLPRKYPPALMLWRDGAE